MSNTQTIDFDKKRLFENPENAAKLQAAIARYGLKMTRKDVQEYLRCSKATAVKWLRGLPYTTNLRQKLYWTEDIVCRDISTQEYEADKPKGENNA